MPFPISETKQLMETHWSIVRALQNNARKPYLAVAKELGYSTRTVKNRIAKLERERATMAFPDLNLGAIDGVIPTQLMYSYTKSEKPTVDDVMVSHFEGVYLWGRLSDPDHGCITLAAPSIIATMRYETDSL